MWNGINNRKGTIRIEDKYINYKNDEERVIYSYMMPIIEKANSKKTKTKETNGVNIYFAISHKMQTLSLFVGVLIYSKRFSFSLFLLLLFIYSPNNGK
jgi:hypothetical protein